jgi:sugar phosphate isomerase/epimerase
MFPGWRRFSYQTDRFWRVVEQSLLELGKLSEEYGISILLENGSYHLCAAVGSYRTPLHLGISPDEMLHLLKLSENKLGISFDFNKAIHSSIPIQDFIAKLGSSIKQVQVSTVERYRDIILDNINTLPLLNKGFSIVLEGGKDEAVSALKLLWNR